MTEPTSGPTQSPKAQPEPTRVLSHDLPATPASAETAAARRGKLRVATISLCGCWGCNLSTLDIDERLIPLFDKVTITRSSFTDIKRIKGRADVGLVELRRLAKVSDLREGISIFIGVSAFARALSIVHTWSQSEE